MLKTFFKAYLPVLISLSGTLCAQTSAEQHLLGIFKSETLQQEPYATWFTPNYNDYQPNQEIIKALKSTPLSNFRIKIVLGTWCGDSKREVPRFLKILEQAGYPKRNLQLIGVDNTPEMYKRSPTGEDRGLEIYRVPTFIFYEKDKEIARINEFPSQSLERDILKIVKKEPYIPNYASFPYIQNWLKQGLLNDENISAAGLANQLKGIVSSESELNAVGYVLMGRGDMTPAIMVFRMNCNLFPTSSNCYDSLGEAYHKAGKNEKALQMYEYAIKLDPNNKNSQEMVEKLKNVLKRNQN